jgi:RHS repeat-associated protein
MLLTIQPVSLADAALFSETGEGNSLLREQALSLSADGQLVVFHSRANDLVPQDTNKASNSSANLDDVFLFNRSTGRTTLVSMNAAGTASGNGSSVNAKLSPDGRFVLFESSASDLVTGVSGNQIYLRDLQAGQTILVSVSTTGGGGNGTSQNGSISTDGRYAVFESTAGNLVGNDTNGRTDVFLRDLQAGTTRLISRTLAGDNGGNGDSFDARLSDNGRFVAFISRADNLVSNDSTNIEDVFVQDLQTGVTELISIDSAGVNQSNAHNSLSRGRAVSSDGRYVIFETQASNLVPQTTASQGNNVYLRDRQLGTTSVVTLSADGLRGTGGGAGSMTPDGRYVAFVSGETDLVTGVSDANAGWDVFLRDLQTGTTRLVSWNAAGTGTGNRASGTGQYDFDFVQGPPVLSDDGRFVAFTGEASDLVAGIADANDGLTGSFGTRRRDVFVRDLQADVTTLVSASRTGTATGNNGSYTPAMSADGRVVAFESHANDLVTGQDNLGFLDVFVRDVSSGANQLVSRRLPEFPEWRLKDTGGQFESATPDGRFVAWINTGSIYVLDRSSEQVTLETVRPNGTPAMVANFGAPLSADGRFLAFASSQDLATLGPGNTTGQMQVWLRDRQSGLTRLVSVNAAGAASSGTVSELAFSPDGRYVAWSSIAADLVANFADGNGANERDVYLRDLHAGITRLVSHLPGSAGQSGNGRSFDPRFSADGRKLVFLSRATDLASGVADTNLNDDVLVYDIATEAVSLVSLNLAGSAAGNRVSGEPVISADGRYVVFSSQSVDLAPGDNPAGTLWDIFRRDLQTGVTELVSVNAAGALSGNQASFEPTVSGDGRYVAFTSDANDLVAGDTGQRDVFVRDMQLGVTTRVSVNVSGGQSDGASSLPLLSPDGRHITLSSTANNLVANSVDANGAHADLYVRDLADGITTLVSVSHTGTTGANSVIASGTALRRTLAADGTLFFTGQPNNLVPGDRNNANDVFAWRFEGGGQIRGTLFDDANGSGVQDGGETGIPHWTVYIDEDGNGRLDSGERNVQTDPGGNYAFTGLAAGPSTVRLALQDGYTRTLPTATGMYQVTLDTAADVVSDRNFGVLAAQVDLQVHTIMGPETALAGHAVNVSWFVRNLGSAAIGGDWQDAVYLSRDGVLDAGDTLVAVLPHTGGLAAGANYAAGTTITPPPNLLGTYRLIVQTDRRRQVVADLNQANNVAAGAPLQISLPTLVVGTPFADQFTAANQDRYYQVSVAAGDSLTVVLDSAAVSGTTELYVRRLQLPTLWEFDFAGRTPGELDQSLTVPVTLPGTYYVLARSPAGAAATSSFAVTATQPVFALESISPDTGGNTGPTTVAIRGTKLTPTTQVSLVTGGTTIDATAIDFRDSTLLYATFELTGRASGAYDVQLSDAGQSSVLGGAFSVVPGQASSLEVFLTTPDVMRAGREGSLVLEYVNNGTSDAVAPLLRVTADKALFKHEGRPEYTSDELYLLGIASSGPAGILRPGERGQIVVTFLSTGPAGQDINFEIFLGDAGATMDWAGGKAAMRPGHIPADAWDAVFANFSAVVGTTVGEYQALLAQAATYLSQTGVYTSDVMRLLAFELDKADAAYTAQSLARVTDATFPTPGADLSFSRQHLQAIHGRYTPGAFGRGWTHNWDIQATTLDDGNAALRFGDSRRFFSKQADGSYRGGIGDHATLTLAGGFYTLTESDSTKWVFHSHGLLDFREEDNGNRITAGYTSGRLTSLTHSSGAAIALAYNAQGRISQLTDPAGRTVTYGYDASGEHLTSYTDKYGTHGYTYVTGQGLPREHALASIDYSDDTHIQYTYDAFGRLVLENRDGGAEAVTYSYSAGGGFTLTDSVGATTALLFDDAGQLVKAIDPLGRVAQSVYDSQRNLLRTDLPLGVQVAYEYDARGNVVRAIDPLGYATEFAYDGRDNLLSFRDARGNATQYNYDAQDNLLAIAYANGTREQFEYDALGNPTQATNRRGAAIGYAYNSRGQLTRKEFADGSHADYTYDARGNLISASDAGGTITLAYNSLDALARITYPGGEFLEFTYNEVAQRTRSVDQDGFTTNYHYDDLGRLESLTDGGGGLIVQHEFDAAGRLIRKDNGNGTATTYEYDPAGQLLRLRHLAPDGTTVNSFFEYTYDALGRRTSQTSDDGTTFYGYDANGQLTSVSLPGGRLIRYAYDAVGNRTSVVDDGVTTLYATGVLNEYVLVGNTVYTYDADGNLVSQADANGTTAYSFNDENRLVGVTGAGLAAAYTYDPLGHRNSATVNGQRTDYLTDPAGMGYVAAEYTGAGLVARYTRGIGLTSRIDAMGAAAYYDFDALGNTVGLTNAAGAYVNRYRFLPFGETTTVLAGLPNPFTFVGQFGVMEDGSGTFHMRLRNYDPMLGRFLSNDPLGLAGGNMNLRSYVFNSPTNAIDPTGEKANTKPAPYKPPKDTRDKPPCGDKKFKGKKDPLFGLGTPTLNYDGFGWEQSYPLVGEDADFYYGEGQYADDGQIHTFRQSKKGDPPNAGPGGGGSCPCDCPPGPPPPAGGSRIGGGKSGTAGSFDPNDITGPSGFGSEHFVTPFQSFPYLIRFENDPEFATAPAQEVFVTHPLDANLDWSRVELDDFGFGPVVIDVPDGLQTYQTRINYQNQDGSPLRVDVTAGLDLATGILTWVFRSLDPLTGLLPWGVFDGFLPVNDENGRGEGFVRYLVRAKPDLSTGAKIDQQASIVFDVNDPVITNTYSNTIDAASPASSVAPLPAAAPGPPFVVTWAGSDDAGGAGIATYDVFVSEEGGPYTLWQSATAETEAVFTGQAGRQYQFASVAIDHVGHREAFPETPDATIRLWSHAWQNQPDPLNVNDDGMVSPLDVLLLINELNGRSLSDPQTFQLRPRQLADTLFPDVNGDDLATPQDVLTVINALNTRTASAGEGESATAADERLATRALPPPENPGLERMPQSIRGPSPAPAWSRPSDDAVSPGQRLDRSEGTVRNQGRIVPAMAAARAIDARLCQQASVQERDRFYAELAASKDQDSLLGSQTLQLLANADDGDYRVFSNSAAWP